jgi:riboflavin biosynthesis pyrimidine reductase
VWPPSPGTELSQADLEELYAYPAGLTHAWVQVNFTTSADGAAELDERSAGLSHPADREIFLLGRDLADVVLVGAGTARAENYRGVRASRKRIARRTRLGLGEVPPIAVVTRSADLDPAAPLFTDTHVPPLVLTTASAPEHRVAALTEAGAEILIAGDDDVDLRYALDLLAERGLKRVDCEGGPTLFAGLVAADRVDQLCLTVAPLLAGGGAARIADGVHTTAPRSLELASILVEDGFTLLRYRRSKTE